MASDASQSAPLTTKDLKAKLIEHDSGKKKSYESTLPPLKARHKNGQVKEVTAVNLCNFMWNYPTAESTSLYFGIGIQPLYRYIKKHWGLSFDEFRDKNLAHTKNALTQKCISMALDQGHFQALKLALKNIAGWSDDISITASANNKSIQLKYSLTEPPQHPPRDVTPESA